MPDPVTLTLTDMIDRRAAPIPWSEGEKIPWNDPDFSRRMLQEHLSQQHDAASRRFEIIDRHVAWIYTHILASRPANVLDLGCGPGLYSQRLARLGCRCTGIDFSPASIEYARAEAAASNLEIQFILADVRQAEFGSGYDLAMFIYGEINVFKPGEMRQILAKAWDALAPGGYLLLEGSSFNAIRNLGKSRPSWSASPGGLFSEQPHLYLYEAFWDEDMCAATERYLIVDAASALVRRYASTSQAYRFDQYRQILTETGFREISRFHSLCGEPADPLESDDDWVVLLAQK